MTKQQKARAHLARAQELLNAQDTLAFGGVSDWIRQVYDWLGNHSKHLAKRARGEQETEDKQVMTSLLRIPDDLITQMINDGRLDGAQLIMLLQVNKDNSTNLNRIIKETLVMMSKRYDDYTIFQKYSTDDLDKYMIYLLVKHGIKRAHPGLLSNAIRLHNTDLLTALLKAGEDVNQNLDPDYTTTPLSYAIHMRRYDIAKILTTNGANVNQKVRDYENPSAYITPLDLAFRRYLVRQANIEGDEFGIVRLLLEKGADPNMMVDLSQRRSATSFMQLDMKPHYPKDNKLLNLLQSAKMGTL